MSATEQRATGLEKRGDADRGARTTKTRRRTLRPVRMRRIAVVAPIDEFSDVLRAVGRDGCVDFHRAASDPAAGSAEAESLEHHVASAERRDGVAALAGWCPAERVRSLTADVGAAGGSLVALPMPPSADPPTLMSDSGRAYRSFSPLVRMYGTVPYADLDPTFLVGITYILMFGVMFGDVGHGALIVAGALLLRSGRIRALSRIRHLWPFLLGAGVTGMAAGLLYGEFFGPTGIVPALWIRPLDQPLRLIGWAVGFGVLLLAAAYALGSVNRWREGGPRIALYAVSGIAGATVFCGAGVVAAGFLAHSLALQIVGGALAGVGVWAAGLGLAARTPGGAAGGVQVGVGLFDLLTRILFNVISFARLAAFGLTHAALGSVVWQGTRGLAAHGPAAAACGVLLFVVGNAAAFALEALVVGVQAMRLEYYELFSRIFEPEGRPFRPFRLPDRPPEG